MKFQYQWQLRKQQKKLDGVRLGLLKREMHFLVNGLGQVEGIKPAGAEVDSTHKVMRFKVLQASVKAYHRNLNTHSSYRDFRRVRAELRDEGKALDSIVLSEYLDKYAQTGKKYIKILQQIIKQNKLTDFDDAKLLPSSIELESLI